MVPMLILGVILALVLVVVLRQATAVDARQLLRVLGWSLGAVILAGVLFLIVSGRMAWALTGLAALAPWVVRGLRVAAVGRQAAGILRGLGLSGGGGLGGPGGFGRADPDPDDQSTVTTRFLRMRLSHATGAMSGVVREGPLRGRALDDLSEQEAASLWQAVQADPESARVLDAWLERARPEWHAAARAAGPEEPPESPASNGPMSRAEALQVLGLEEGASADDVRAAHRRLIVLVHPDRGGTPYLAARLNQARDVLLGDGRR
ncbi:hypothetical protein [uncultured Rhodospira sp.]|uniref:hypothetical protein n=1 Tax=uncultured Rhodospira sp. TaxID=1936189 RepID=UPI002606B779|nr:hypothetical protein [uncultured Rhodospira sp.]